MLNDLDRFSNAATLVPITPMRDVVTAIPADFDAPPVAVTADAPVHPRTRAAIRTLVPNTAARVQQRWEAVIRSRVDQLADEIAAHGATSTVDLVERFTRRLPMLVMLDITGVPMRDAHRIQQWSGGFVDLVLGTPGPQLSYARHKVWTPCGSTATA